MFSGLPFQEQNIFVEISEQAPISTLLMVLGDEHSHGKVHFVMAGGNEQEKFTVEADSGKVLTTGELDRERTADYRLRIEVPKQTLEILLYLFRFLNFFLFKARSRPPFDQLLYVTNLHVGILDSNDNAPNFTGPYPLMLSTRLDQVIPRPRKKPINVYLCCRSFRLALPRWRSQIC